MGSVTRPRSDPGVSPPEVMGDVAAVSITSLFLSIQDGNLLGTSFLTCEFERAGGSEASPPGYPKTYKDNNPYDATLSIPKSLGMPKSQKN